MTNDVAISPGMLLLIYGVLVVFTSMAGGWSLLAMHLSHARLQMAVSLVAGLMLGMAVLHFIPHASHELPNLEVCMLWVLTGFLMMFFLQRFLPYHHHDVGDEASEVAEPRECAHQHIEHSHHQPHQGHEHHHGHHPSRVGAQPGGPKYSWLATAVGLSLHSITGGVALAAAVVSEVQVHGGVLVGLGTALAIILHKPFDAITILTLMLSEGCSRKSRHVLNGLFALMTPLGMGLFYVGATHFAQDNPVVLGAALAFCAGTFLCIACADLLPELQFHTHDRLKLSLALVAGLGIAVLIGKLGHSDAGHDHAPSVQPGTNAIPDVHNHDSSEDPHAGHKH